MTRYLQVNTPDGLTGAWRRADEGFQDDAFFGADGGWHFSSKIHLAGRGQADEEFVEVDRADLESWFVEHFGSAKLLDGPTVPRAERSVNEIQATAVAEHVLKDLETKVGAPLALFGGAFGIPSIENKGDVWVANWNSLTYIASGSFRDQVLSGPIAIPKNGDPYLILPTWGSTDEVLDEWRGQRVWPVPVD